MRIAAIILLFTSILNAKSYYIKDMACEVCVDYISYCADSLKLHYEVILEQKTLVVKSSKYDEAKLLKCLKDNGYEASNTPNK